MSILVRLNSLYEINHSGHATMYVMEGLRGLAVFLVFLVHFTTLVEPWIIDGKSFFAVTSVVRSLGNIGVDLFFVLSGYLIYGSLIKRRQGYIDYLRRRVERIYPVFSLVFFVYLGLSYVFPEYNRIPVQPWSAVRYLSENFLLFPGIFDIEPIITVAWSLSYEMFFYLSVPIIIEVFGLRMWSSVNRQIFFVLLASCVLIWPDVFGGHVRFAMFIAGILTYEIMSSGKKLRMGGVFGVAGAAGALVITVMHNVYSFNGQLKFAVLAVSFISLCVGCFSSDGWFSKTLRYKPVRWLGNISYSYYLLHGMVLNGFFLLFAKLVPPSGHAFGWFWSAIVVAFILTFVMSSVLFAFVERPFSLDVRRKVGSKV